MHLSQPTASETSTAFPPLALVVLGSGGPAAYGRAASSYLVLIDGVARMLVDAGSGAFVRLGEAKIDISSLDTLFLTHLHIDHTADIPSILKARGMIRKDPMSFSVFGPQGKDPYPSTSQFMHLLFGTHGAFAYQKTFGVQETITAVDLPIDLGSPAREVFARDGVTVHAVATQHGETPASAYRIDYQAASLVFSGDLDPSALSNLTRLAQGADVLVFSNAVLDPPGSPAPLYRLHTPPQQIGQVAAAAGIKMIVLSHLSPAIDQAREQVMQSIQKAYAGKAVFATDLMRIDPGSITTG